MKDLLSQPARLLRGFAVDFLTCHEVGAVARIMEPDYRLTIGTHVFEGRDAAYLPATAAQLEQFPGLCVTVHDVILAEDSIAMRFTEHGASRSHAGRAAAWGGITLFNLRNGRLACGWAEEDYFARKRQLSSGQCDAVRAPHQAPWDVAIQPSHEASLQAARRWLSDPQAIARAQQVEQICAGGPTFADLIDVEAFEVDVLFSAADRVAFRASARGRYAGGFPDIPPSRVGERIAMGVAGMMRVTDGQIDGLQIVFDRLGLNRTLKGR